jgi:isopentenyl-diphosphate delta-isomerase
MNNKNSELSILGKRKAEHIEISLQRDVEFKSVSTGFENYNFVHQALPGFDLDDVDPSIRFFGKRLLAPIIISSMVGGVEEASRINRNLAVAAQYFGLAMGVGSQRCAVEEPGLSATFQVRDVAPDIFLCANLGAVQLNYGWGAAECLRAVEMIGADALILHLNPLQEALQPEGNTKFAGLLEKIEYICRSLTIPVIVKEVSFGISESVARKLAAAGVSGIDVAGAGGTSWSEVEKYRAGCDLQYKIAGSFESWGIPTAESILMARRGASGIPVIASGGIRTGLDVAKAVALGSHAAGLALPLLKAACSSPEAAIEALQAIISGLRIAMFCAGARDIPSLQKTQLQSKRSRG